MSTNVGTRLQRVRDLPGTPGNYDALIEAAHDQSMQVADAALERLVRTGDPELGDRLALIVFSVDIDTAPACARAAITLGASTIPESWLERLHDPNPTRRLVAALALRELADPSCAGALLEAVEDPIGAVRRTAVEALARVGAARLLVDRKRLRSDQDESVRRALVRALATLRPTPLASFLDDPAPAVRVELARQAAVLSADTIGALLGDSVDDVRVQALWALVESPRPELATAVSALLSDPTWQVRRAACRALAASGTREAAPEILPLLADEQAIVRAAAIRALRELVDQPELVGLLVASLDRAPPALRRAIAYVPELASNRSALERLAEDPDPEVRVAVVHAGASGAGSSSNAALFSRLISDDDPGVRHAALSALEATRETD